MRWVTYEAAKAFYRRHGSAILLILSAVVFFVALYYVLDTYPPKDDVINFHNQAEMIKSGMVPYKDFVFEFPPFALLFFLIPSMFTSELDTYAQIFGIMVTLISIICLYYVLKISERMGVNKALVTFIFVALMLLYYKELVVKFDTIPMALTIMSIYYFQRGNRHIAYGLAMVGALVKIYPIFLIVVFLILDLVDRRDSRRVRILRGLFSCMLVGLISIAPLLVAGASFGDIMSFLTFHTERGFQVESVAGVVIQALGLLGLTTFSLENIYGTYDVISPVSDAILPYWNVLVAIVILLVLFVIARHAIREGSAGSSDRNVVIYATVVFLAFILTNKVFSTQYMLWLFPLFALIASVPGRRQNWLMIAYLLIIELLAAIMMMDYLPGTGLFVEENLIRDAMMIALMVSLLLYIAGKGRIFAHHYRKDKSREGRLCIRAVEKIATCTIPIDGVTDVRAGRYVEDYPEGSSSDRGDISCSTPGTHSAVFPHIRFRILAYNNAKRGDWKRAVRAEWLLLHPCLGIYAVVRRYAHASSGFHTCARRPFYRSDRYRGLQWIPGDSGIS